MDSNPQKQLSKAFSRALFASGSMEGPIGPLRQVMMSNRSSEISILSIPTGGAVGPSN
jgi:hypothetical protein